MGLFHWQQNRADLRLLSLSLLLLLLQASLLLVSWPRMRPPVPPVPVATRAAAVPDPFSLACRASRWAPPAGGCAVLPARRPHGAPPASRRFAGSGSLKSQFGEDAELFDRVFWGVRDGVFLEMGALDGERYSNTWFFEKEMGWRGLLIEGSPKNYARLLRKRPDAIRVNAAVCDDPSRVLHFVENDRDGGNRWTTEVGGFWEFFDEAYKKKHHSKLTDEMVAGFPTVRCTRMEEIFERFGIGHVDLWSLDVEKAEEVVLRSVDWARFSASVILLEIRRTGGGSEGAARFLRSQGYREFQRISNGRNAIFVHPRFRMHLAALYPDGAMAPPAAD